MQFRLTYEGPLLGDQSNKPRTRHKHDIRRQFHGQLKHLWASHRWLREGRIINPHNLSDPDNQIPMLETLTKRYCMFGYRFVPLVRRDLSLICAAEILFLRREVPGGVIRSGDMDNRIKTLFDALRMPHGGELPSGEQPQDGEDPFFVLLEDDSLITSVNITTDRLLTPLRPDEHIHEVVLIIKVESIIPTPEWHVIY